MELVPFLLRLSPEEKAALEKRAARNLRSLNSEIRAIVRIEIERAIVRIEDQGELRKAA